MKAHLYNLGLLFSHIARRHSNRPALRYAEDKAYSYAEIDALSNRIAASLDAQGICKGQVVAVFNDKSAEGFCLMLACLKIGAIYTNLDFNSPPERLHRILDTCRPAALFHGGHCMEAVEQVRALMPGLPVTACKDPLFLQSLPASDPGLPKVAHAVHGGDPAYIMFTSGSTGFPKGAVMSHDNLQHFIRWGQATFQVGPDDVFSNVNPIYFDNSVFDFYTALFSGACLAPIDHNDIKDPRRIMRLVEAARCTVWLSVPSLLVYLLVVKALEPDCFTSLRTMIFGGEGFPKARLKQLYDMYGRRMALVNVYGPTECTCICSSYRISDRDFEHMQELAPLGAIAPGFGYEILPSGDDPGFGELALCGPCVGLGYYNDPARTAAAFVQNPAKGFRDILYKTGDLVQRDAKGLLHFKGRIDNQIKHLGYRIELEEIEAALNSLPGVNESAAVYRKISPELGQIIAFAGVGAAQADTAELLKALRNFLPPYMMPKKLYTLEYLPKNENGKVDRGRLQKAYLNAPEPVADTL